MKKITSFTYQEFLSIDNENIFDVFGNHHEAIRIYVYSTNDDKILYNPFSIKVEEMYKHFGNPNFVNEYNDEEAWAIEFNDNIFIISASEREGSQIYQKISKLFNASDEECKNMYLFYQTIMNLLRNREFEK